MKIPHYVPLVSILALFAGSVPALAQDSNPLTNVRIITVKSEHVNDWIELQQESTEASKKAGGPGRSVWEEIKGDHNTFHIVTELESWADYDTANEPIRGEAEQANWINDIIETVQSRREITYRTFDDLKIEADDGKQPNLVSIRLVTVKPGQSGAYEAWLRDKLVPALRKLGSDSFSCGRVVMGDNLNSFYTASRLDSWAELDEPAIFASLSAEERAAIFEGQSDMLVESKRVMLRYHADLSYEGPKK